MTELLTSTLDAQNHRDIMQLFKRLVVIAGFCSGGLTGCGDQPLSALPPLERVILTSERRLVPAHPIGPDLGNPALFENLPQYLALGYGELRVLPGDRHYARTLDGRPPPEQLGLSARRLLRFVSVGDFQLMDDESPTRVGILDAKEITGSALRPQDPYMCHLANAAVRTINALHRMDPLSMVFVGGDTLDNAQENEAEWALSILTGGQPVECDSGEDDDLIPGPANDPKDPFLPEGLLVPWKWVPGNHDMLIQGNGVVDSSRIEVAMGDFAPFGTRDYQQGGTVVQKPIIADARRRPLKPMELMLKLAQHGDGHGLTQSQAETGHASYFFDIAGTPLRFLVLDTVSKTGGAGGVLRWSEVNKYIRPALDAARREGKWVIVFSDNAYDDLGQANLPFGQPVSDAVTPDEWLRFMGGYENVLFTMARSFDQAVRALHPTSGHSYWDVLNGALGDSPHQLRLFELWDADNGYVLLRVTCVDVSVDGDPLAEEGRRRAITDVTSTWRSGPVSKPDERNVDLWIRKP